MTDKQIIIDGVDVSGCDFLAKEDDYCSYSGEYRAYKGQCGCSDEEMCKDHPNCFYKKVLKQLKAKEQECNKYKQTLTEIEEIAMCIMDNDLEESSAYYNAKQILQKISEVEDEN